MGLLALYLSALACSTQGAQAASPPPNIHPIKIGERVADVLADHDVRSEDGKPERRYALAVTESGPVTIMLESYDFNALLRVESEGGKLLAEDDDSGVETDARIVLAVESARAYTIVVSSKKGHGEFALAVHAGDAPMSTGASLLDAGIAWRVAATERALERGDKQAAAKHRTAEGNRRLSRSQFPEAKAAYDSSLALARELGDPASEGAALINLGCVYCSLGDYPLARQHFEEGLGIARQARHREWEANALGNLGSVCGVLGDYPRAREYFEQDLALRRELGDREGEAATLGNLGNVYLSLGDFVQARAYVDQHLALARELGDRASEANALRSLGHAFVSLGDFGRAREHFDQHLALVRELGDRAGEGNALGNLGSVYDSLGDYVKAREHTEQSLALARELGDRDGEARALGKLGNVDYGLGDYSRARENYEQQLALSRELGDRDREAAALGNLGNVHDSLRDRPRALEYYEESLALARELGDRAGEARALGNLATVYDSLRDWPRALEYYEESLALARELGDRAGEARALGNLGSGYQSLGDYSRARELASAADALARDLGLQEFRVHFLDTLARAALSLQELAPALAALDEAERLLGELSSSELERDQSSGVRGRFAWLGRTAQGLAALRLQDAGGDADARRSVISWGLAGAGRWKGRALLEGIAEHRAGGRSAEAIRLRRERREVLASHAAILVRVSKAIQDAKPAEEVDALRDEAGSRLAEAEQLAARLREVSPEDAALDLPLGASPDEVRCTVLGPRDLLIEYAEGEKRLYAYVLGDGVLEFVDLGARADVDAEVEVFLGGIRDLVSLAGPADVARAGRALFERLLAPALAATKGPVERLVIVPSASLAALPFEALVVESATDSTASFAELSFVLDRYETTYGPSSPVLVELASIAPRQSGGRVLLLADPRYASEPADETVETTTPALLGGQRALPDASTLARLPKTREEAFAIAERLIGNEAAADLLRLRRQRSGSLAAEHLELHLGAEASRARLKGDLRGYSVVHLACHGFVDPEFPQRSGVALAASDTDPGWFTILDALELDLDANLVVLSACETARGEAKSGEGVESLARAFLYAGARAVVASLWQVADWAAAETMQALYQGALERGLPPARALREAKLTLRRSRAVRGIAAPSARPEAQGQAATLESGHPFFWAPFIHVGLARSGGGERR